MARVVRSLPARRDLKEIARFIGVERNSPAAAVRLLDEFERKMESYARQPLMGDIREDLGDDLRSFVVHHNYVVIYRPMDDGIEVVRVFHAARDYGRLFGE